MSAAAVDSTGIDCIEIMKCAPYAATKMPTPCIQPQFTDDIKMTPTSIVDNTVSHVSRYYNIVAQKFLFVLKMVEMYNNVV